MINGLPVYQFLIDDTNETGVKAISIVTDPAFQSPAVYFANKRFIKLADAKKQLVAGLSLIPDLPVYREDPETGEAYYGYFSAETIVQIVDKYHEEMLTNQVNLDHNSNDFIDAYLVEDFIVDSQARVDDLAEKGIKDVKLGSWYTVFKVKDLDTFEQITSSGNKTGFSVEVFLDKVLTDFNNKIKNNLINNKVKTEMKKNKKSLLNKILEIFKEESLERALVPELAFEIEWSEIGAPVYKIIVTDGVEVPELVGQGEFTTEEGVVVVDEASNLVEIREIPEVEPVEVPPVPAEEPPVPAEEPLAIPTTGDTKMRGIDTPINALVDLGNDGLYMIDVMVKDGQIADAVLNSQRSLLSKQYAFGDMEKRLKEFIPTDKAGSYTISVDVNENGEYTWGSVSSWTQLKFKNESEIQILNARIAELELQMKDPITDPILAPEPQVKDFNKMTPYEKLMHNKGLKAV